MTASPAAARISSRTGQAGLLLIRKLERRRDSCRVEYVAGYRALAAVRGDFGLLTESSALLSCGLADVPAGITKMAAERREQFSATKRLEERLALLEARALLREHDESRGAPLSETGSTEPRVVAVAVPEATAAYLALLAARLAAVNNVVALLVSRDGGHVVFAQSKGLSSDLGAAVRQCLKEFAGKGGGSRDFAQGSLPNPADADSFLARARSLLQS